MTEQVPEPVFDLNAVPIRAESTAWQQVGDEMVILDLDGQRLRGINEVAGRIWELTDGHRSARETAGALIREFQVSRDQAEQDVSRFLGKLQVLGLVTIVPHKETEV